MNIVIREAVKEDCQRMMELINELAVYERSADEVTVSFDHFVETGFGVNPTWWAFVASPGLPTCLPDRQAGQAGPSEGGEQAKNVSKNGASNIVGFALYYIRYSTWKGSRLYLEDMLVTEKLRGKGIGKLLFDRLIEEAKEKKYSGMMWQVLDWNEPAINFYKKYDGVNIDSGWLNCNINFNRSSSS